MNQPSSMDKFRGQLYDLIKAPPEARGVIQGSLDADQTALYDAIMTAVDGLFNDAALEIAIASSDAIGIMLLSIYNEGSLPGQIQSAPLQKVAQLLIEKATTDAIRTN